jgi:hypothetical protein
VASASRVATVANDALLVQLVRGASGRDVKVRGLSRPSLSSCKFIVTMLSSPCMAAPGDRKSGMLSEAVRRVPGVRGVVNKMVVAQAF